MKNGQCTMILHALVALVCINPVLAAWQESLDRTFLLSPEPSTSFLVFDFGRTLAVADFNGDGFEDLVVMETGATVRGFQWAGRGWILLGPSFEPLTTFHAAAPVWAEQLGMGGCCTGDVNADGFPDILVGCPEYAQNDHPRVGRAHVFLGPDYTTDIVIMEEDRTRPMRLSRPKTRPSHLHSLSWPPENRWAGVTSPLDRL